MSILVAGPGQLLTDSQETGERKGYGPKSWVMHGYLIGVAGESGPADQLLETDSSLWPVFPDKENLIRAVQKWPQGAGENTDWLVVTAEEAFVISSGYVYPQKFPCAIGSGASLAIGRLDAAPNQLREAVAVAIRYDPNCGGRIRQLSLSQT